jgi:cyclic dehypoxanthinyl futalosine synthase
VPATVAKAVASFRLKIGQVALGFGADDMGSVMIEENLVSAADTTHRTTTDELVHLIRSMGNIPVQRDTLYRDVKVFG